MRAAKIRTITIVVREKDGGLGDFDVHDGESVATRLCWDEMLGCVATLTHWEIKHPLFMRGPDTIVNNMERWNRVITQKEEHDADR